MPSATHTTGTTTRTGSAKFTDQDYRDQADFRYAVRRFSRFSEEQARMAGITPQQHLLLLAVRGHTSYPNVTIGEVAERLQIRQHSASLLVQRCVKRGLLKRGQDDSDRRRVPVSLSVEGQRILDQITDANRRELGRLEGALFRDSLREALQAFVGDGGPSSAESSESASASPTA